MHKDRLFVLYACSNVIGPGKNKGNREARYRGDDKKPQRGFRETPGREENIGNLDDEPGAHDVETGHPVNMSSSQFAPETHAGIMDQNLGVGQA